MFQPTQRQLGAIYRRARALEIRDIKRELKRGPDGDDWDIDEREKEVWEEVDRIKSSRRFSMGSARYFISQLTCADCEKRFYKLHAVEAPVRRCEGCVAERALDRKRERERGLRDLPPPPSPMKCSQCGTKFQPKSHTTRTKFCTSACRQAAYRDRVARRV